MGAKSLHLDKNIRHNAKIVDIKVKIRGVLAQNGNYGIFLASLGAGI
jgi:hypothetical protein